MVCLAEPKRHWGKNEYLLVELEDKYIWMGPGRIIRVDKFVFIELFERRKKEYTKKDKWIDIAIVVTGLIVLVFIALKYFF